MWRRCIHVEHRLEGCDALTIQELELQEAVERGINDLLDGRDTFLSIMQANILQMLENNSSEQIAEIDHRLVEQQ